jgi:methylated-DNA-protein-cysteine methyltransferase related protein
LPSFPSRVYAIVRQVPVGRVITYGTIARLLGDPRKAREVGWAMAAAHTQSPPIPAHRVINARGALSGGAAFGGYGVQRSLLEAEGVRFTADGRVDLEQYLWLPAIAASGCDAPAGEQSRDGDQDDGAHHGDN